MAESCLSTGLGFGLASVNQKSRAALPRSACAIEFQKQHARARAYGHLRGASQGDEVGRIIDEPHGPAKVIGAAVVCKVPISDRTEARGRQFS
jgi:hypothetical protein